MEDFPYVWRGVARQAARRGTACRIKRHPRAPSGEGYREISRHTVVFEDGHEEAKVSRSMIRRLKVGEKL